MLPGVSARGFLRSPSLNYRLKFRYYKEFKKVYMNFEKISAFTSYTPLLTQANPQTRVTSENDPARAGYPAPAFADKTPANSVPDPAASMVEAVAIGHAAIHDALDHLTPWDELLKEESADLAPDGTPAYPIFFPTYTPTPTGYAREWWWYDPGCTVEDVGPFPDRGEAVADWAVRHFTLSLQRDLTALDIALGQPLLQVPQPTSTAGLVGAGVAQAAVAESLGMAEQHGLTEQALAMVESLQMGGAA